MVDSSRADVNPLPSAALPPSPESWGKALRGSSLSHISLYFKQTDTPEFIYNYIHNCCNYFKKVVE